MADEMLNPLLVEQLPRVFEVLAGVGLDSSDLGVGTTPELRRCRS